MTEANKRQSWQALASHYKEVSKLHLRELFKEDPQRGERMAVEAVGLYFDYSKNRVTDETLQLLFLLAEAAGLRSRIESMFRGDVINVTRSNLNHDSSTNDLIRRYRRMKQAL